MADTSPSPAQGETGVTVHYWAAARAAAGTPGELLPSPGPLSLSEVVVRAVALHPGTRLGDVLAMCSVLVGDEPVGTRDPDVVMVEPGSTVEFLPPFAGG